MTEVMTKLWWRYRRSRSRSRTLRRRLVRVFAGKTMRVLDGLLPIYTVVSFLTVILHRGLRNDFFFSIPIWTFISLSSLDFYFPFSLWTFISLLFLFSLFSLVFYFPFSLFLFNRGHILDFFQIFSYHFLAAGRMFAKSLDPTLFIRPWYGQMPRVVYYDQTVIRVIRQ